MEQDKWVLCMHQDPLENERVLLTFKNSAGAHIGVATFKQDAYYYVVEAGEVAFEDIYRIPVAWMKMPNPYRF